MTRLARCRPDPRSACAPRASAAPVWALHPAAPARRRARAGDRPRVRPRSRVRAGVGARAAPAAADRAAGERGGRLRAGDRRDARAAGEWAASVQRDPVPGSPAPSWENSYWGGVDAAALVSELRRRDPRDLHGDRVRLLDEVRPGRDRLLRAAHARSSRLTRSRAAEVDALCDSVLRSSAADVDPGASGPQAGDVLLIDGSHMAFMNSDAAVLLHRGTTRPSAPGVLVAVHDVFLPWDYPPTWELAALLAGSTCSPHCCSAATRAGPFASRPGTSPASRRSASGSTPLGASSSRRFGRLAHARSGWSDV